MKGFCRAPALASIAWMACLNALHPPAAHAAWPPSGLPLATGPADQRLPVGLTAPGGDLYVFWVAIGSGAAPLRAKRITIQGTTASGWPDSGRVVVTPLAAVARPEITPDGAGGFLIAWYDYRVFGGPRGIYATRVDAQGAVPSTWIPAGRVICNTFNPDRGPVNDLVRICSDGSGGAYVAWTDSRNTEPMSTLVYDVFAHHVLADGSLDPAWPFEGLGLTTNRGYKYPHALIADGAGGFWLVTENPSATYQLRVTHHATNGSVIGTWTTPSYTSHSAAVSDGAGGVFLAWDDCRDCIGGGSDAIYVVRLGPGAVPAAGWAVGGVQVAGTSHDERLPAIVATGGGAAVVAWLTHGGGGNDWYSAQRLESNGALTAGWPAGGRTFATSTNILDGWPLIVPDGVGGAMFAFRRNTPNLFGSRVTSAGIVPVAFPDTGLALCSLSDDQFLMSLVSDGLNGAYVLWEDRRDDPPNWSDVYAMRFTRDGLVGPSPSPVDTLPPTITPTALAMSQPAPNPMSLSCGFRLFLPVATHARVEVLDLTGRVVDVLLDETRAAGSHDLRWDGHDRDGQRMRAGIYLMRAQAGNTTSVRRVALLGLTR